jgi:CoA:oxalate CoA-transferase
MDAPLHGLRVIDFTRVLAGPYCTKLLRDLGADVTKIEPPAGDAGRAGVPHVNNMSVYYTQQNAGKRNISIDPITAPRSSMTVEITKAVSMRP